MCLCLLSRNIEDVYQHIYIHGLRFDGLTDGVAFVVKYKKSKIKCIIMNAFQVSTMHTIIDAFPVIRSKAAIECAQ